MQTEAYTALALTFSEPFELHSGSEDVTKQRRLQPHRVTAIDLYAHGASVIVVIEGGWTYPYLCLANLNLPGQRRIICRLSSALDVTEVHRHILKFTLLVNDDYGHVLTGVTGCGCLYHHPLYIARVRQVLNLILDMLLQ